MTMISTYCYLAVAGLFFFCSSMDKAEKIISSIKIAFWVGRLFIFHFIYFSFSVFLQVLAVILATSCWLTQSLLFTQDSGQGTGVEFLFLFRSFCAVIGLLHCSDSYLPELLEAAPRIVAKRCEAMMPEKQWVPDHVSSLPSALSAYFYHYVAISPPPGWPLKISSLLRSTHQSLWESHLQSWYLPPYVWIMSGSFSGWLIV